jgi:hypothetical protein
MRRSTSVVNAVSIWLGVLALKNAKSPRGGLRVFHFGLRKWATRVAEVTNHGGCGHNLVQQFHALPNQVLKKISCAGDVGTRTVEACY